MQEYKPKKNLSYNLYTINHYQHLNHGNNKIIFKQLRTEIFALDSNILEEYTKVYIAYKLNTNFVDIAPLTKGLKLYLNINTNEIDDPRKICRDVTNIGTWGNGNTEVLLDSVDKINYCIGLIRQALEKQL